MGVGGLGVAKLNMDEEGAGEDFCGGLEAKAAKGSDECDGDWGNDGPGVVERDVVWELVREANGS